MATARCSPHRELGAPGPERSTERGGSACGVEILPGHTGVEERIMREHFAQHWDQHRRHTRALVPLIW